MGRAMNTAAAITAAVVNRSAQKKVRRRADKINQANRNVANLGRVFSDQLIPCNTQMGNICISGGTDQVRAALLVQNCRQSVSIGVPTIILHEGNSALEQALRQNFSGHRYMRIVNRSDPYYEPVFRLSDDGLARMIVEASLPEQRIGPAGMPYLKAVSLILRKKGITPYIRMLASCPHHALAGLILQLESAGVIEERVSDSMRNDIEAGSAALPAIKCFFSQLDLESDILAWKSRLSRCTSIAECIKMNGILCLDLTSCAKKAQMSLIAAEIEESSKAGVPFRIIIYAVSIAENEKLVKVLKTASGSLAWTISCPDLNRMTGAAPGELAAWLALSHRAVLFSHGVQACRLLSAELGEYDHIDVVQSQAGNSSIGQLGFHFGTNAGLSTSNKRERVFKPEDIEGLADKEFILLDNYNASLGRGVLTV